MASQPPGVAQFVLAIASSGCKADRRDAEVLTQLLERMPWRTGSLFEHSPSLPIVGEAGSRAWAGAFGEGNVAPGWPLPPSVREL